MTGTQLLIILLFFALTGWFIAWLMIKLLFWPMKPISIVGFRIQGLIPAKKENLANEAGSLIQSAFLDYRGFDEKIADPALLEKLKPQIEAHVDHFLKEKLKAVFPLLAQFMGEKTISQFKTAFLIEIDQLFPVLMKDYIGNLKDEIRLDQVVSAKINALSVGQLQDLCYQNAGKTIRNFKILCTCLGLFMGLITTLILTFVNI